MPWRCQDHDIIGYCDMSARMSRDLLKSCGNSVDDRSPSLPFFSLTYFILCQLQRQTFLSQENGRERERERARAKVISGCLLFCRSALHATCIHYSASDPLPPMHSGQALIVAVRAALLLTPIQYVRVPSLEGPLSGFAIYAWIVVQCLCAKWATSIFKHKVHQTYYRKVKV